MRVVFVVLAAVLPYALAFGGVDSPAPMASATMSSDAEPNLGAGAEVGLQSATPSGCGKNLDCWSCEGSSSPLCNWNVNGCATATSSPNMSKCQNANPQYVSACDTKSNCGDCTYQQGCIWYGGQCKYSESGNCQNDPTCANTSSQCPQTDPCASVTDCGGCALTNNCAWSSTTNKCTNNCTSGCSYTLGQCPYSYCNNYNSCSSCTSVSGCIFAEGKCVQSSKACPYSYCQNTPNECPSTPTGCAANNNCTTCVRDNKSGGGKCSWQSGQCKDYCDSFSTCTTQDYQC